MYRKLRRSLVLLVAAVLLIAPRSGAAAAGDLDPSFGVGGFATAPANSTYPSTAANEIALTPAGQILAASSINDAGTYLVTVQRFNSNGTIDSSFGDNGLATAAMPAGIAINQVTGVGAQPDGSVVVGARVYPFPAGTPGHFGVVRFTPTGQLDAGFDGDTAGNGVLLLDIGPIVPPAPSETARNLIVEPSGKIVMSGESFYPSYASLAIGRLNVNGTWDSSFSGDGKLSIPFTTTDLDFWALADVPGDAGYVLGGRALPNTAPTITQPTLVRITEGGELDASFSGGAGNKSSTPGVVTYYWSADNTKLGEVRTVAVAHGGGFVAGGYQNMPGQTYLGMARFTANGALDSSFGTNGVQLDLIGGGNSLLWDIATQPDGKILGGLSGVDGNTGFVGRFNTNGARDPSFGNGGLVDPLAFNSDRIELQPDGKLLVKVARPGQMNTTLMRLMPDDPVTPPPADPALTITSPAKKKLKRSKLRKLAGTAGPAGLVKKVEIALLRKDSKLLKKKKRCQWLSSTKAKFKSVKATKGKCSKPYYRAASGTTNWKYALTKKLPAGSYALTAKVTLTSGRSAEHSYMFRLER